MRIGNRSLPAITLAMLAVMACSPAEQQPAPSTEDAVTTVFEPLNEGLQPGAAVLVMKDGEVVYREGFGFADLENKVRITPESVFRLGSVSKQFTTMAIMVLAEQGKLDYDDLLSKRHAQAHDVPHVGHPGLLRARLLRGLRP